jgi:hypothetical protein
MFEVATSVVFVENDDDRDWLHAVKGAVMDQRGSFEPLEAASRLRLIETIRSRGYPEAALDYSPPEDGSLPRLIFRPRRRD